MSFVGTWKVGFMAATPSHSPYPVATVWDVKQTSDNWSRAQVTEAGDTQAVAYKSFPLAMKICY